MKQFAIFMALSTLALSASASSCALADLESPDILAERFNVCIIQEDVLTSSSDESIRLQNALIHALETSLERSITKPDPRYVEIAEASVKWLERIHADRPSDHRTLYATYLNNAKLTQAKSLVADGGVAFPPNALFPSFSGLTKRLSGSARYWRSSEDGGEFTESEVDLKKGGHLIIVSTPGCHFCNDAATWIDVHPALRAVFSKYALWVDRPDTHFNNQFYSQWNRAHRTSRMNTIFDLKEWIVPKVWATPQFFFVSNGALVASVEGWTDQSPQKIVAGFQLIGVPIDASVGCPDTKVSHTKSGEDVQAQIDVIMAPIRSLVDLANYSGSRPIEDTPLGKLSPAARERFIGELRFGPRGGLASFSTADIESELTLSEAYSLLSLFGEQKNLSLLNTVKFKSKRDREIGAIIMPGMSQPAN